MAATKHRATSERSAGPADKAKVGRLDVAGEDAAGAIPVLYRVTRRHRDAVEDAARRMRDARGGRGRVNASAVLRALLDQWISEGCRPPAGKDEE